MGRSALFGGPFADIVSAQPGQVITVTTGEGVATYHVTGVRHAGDPDPPPLAAGAGRLTLETSYGSGWRSAWAPSQVVFLDASLQGKAFGSTAGRPDSVPRDELAMRADPGALIELVLWLPLLLGAVLAVVWAVARWGRWQSWVIGVPIVLAALWGVSQTAVQLLPNLA